MSSKRIAALIVVAALGGFVLGRLSTHLVLRIPVPPPRIDSSRFILDNPGSPAADSELVPLDGSPFLGPAAAKVTVLMFVDFECPYCRRAAPVLLRLMERYPDDLRLVLRHLPLPMHENAALVAQASLAAHAQGRFWPFHDRLFMSREPLVRPVLEAIAGDAGLDMETFRQALDAGTYRAQVEADSALARRLGISGTPSFLVNGLPVHGMQSFEAFLPIIDAELAAAEEGLSQGVPLAEIYRQRVQANRPDSRPTQPPLPVPATEPAATTVRVAPAPTDANGIVEMRVFADYSAPSYADFGRGLEQLIEDYGDRLFVSFNSLVDPDNPLALLISAAMYQAVTEDKLMEFHHHLVTPPGILSRHDIERVATEIGLDRMTLQQVLDDPTNREIAIRHRQRAQEQRVNVAPTVFVGPHRFVGLVPIDDLRTAIRSTLGE